MCLILGVLLSTRGYTLKFGESHRNTVRASTSASPRAGVAPRCETLQAALAATQTQATRRGVTGKVLTAEKEPLLSRLRRVLPILDKFQRLCAIEPPIIIISFSVSCTSMSRAQPEQCQRHGTPAGDRRSEDTPLSLCRGLWQ